MSPRRPPAPGTGGIPDPVGGSRPPRARVDGPAATARKAPAAAPAARKATAGQPAKKTPAKKTPAPKYVRRPETFPGTPEERAAAAKKKRAAAKRAQTAAVAPGVHTPHKNRARTTTATRSGGLRPTSTRPGSARPRAGSSGRGARKRGFGAGSGRPVWVLGAVGVVLALLILPYFQKWLVQRSEIASVRAEVDQAQEDVTSLTKQKERWKDDDYVRAQARIRMQYVMPGETGYVVDDPTSTPEATGDADSPTSVPSGSRSWFSDIWLSAEAAGSAGRAQATTEVP